MLSHQPSTTPTLGRALRTLVASDPFVRLGLAINGAIAFFLLLPGVPIELERKVWSWVSLAVPLLLLFALLWRRDEIAGAWERRFWNYLTLGFGFLLAAGVLARTSLLDGLSPPLGNLWPSLFPSIFYFFVVLASECEPDRAYRPTSSRLETLITWPVAGIFVFGFLVYFIFLPYFGPATPKAGDQAMFHLFIALDTYLILRFGVLAHLSSSPHWRLMYASWVLTLCGWLIDDSIQLILPSSPADRPGWQTFRQIFWLLLPWLSLVSVRLRHQPLTRGESARGAVPYESAHLPAASSRTLILALSFPTVHLLFHQLGLLEAPYKPARTVVAFGWMALLGLMALVQMRLLDRRAGEIWDERKRFENQLSSSEDDLRLILERRHAARSLKVAEDRFERIFRTCPDAIAITTESEGRIVDANLGFERATGFEREELLGRTFAEIGLGSYPGGREELLRQLDKRGTAIELEINFRQRPGKMRIARLLLDRLTIGGQRCLITIARDVTERRKLEIAREKQAVLLENASTAIFALDGEERISFWNRSAERLFGQKAGEALGHPAENLEPVPERGAAIAIDLWSTAILDEQGRPAGRLVIASEAPSS